MNKITLVLLLQAFLVLGLKAQPAFTINDLPNIGDLDSICHTPYTGNASDLKTETGNNYTWDFSDVSFLASIYNVHEFRVPTAPESAPFVDATIEEFVNGVSGVGIVSLYDYSNDTLFIHRTGAGGTGTAFVPPMPSIAFPISYGDSSHIVAPLYAAGNIAGERRTTFHYDGFGTLTMPDNRTFSDVFRVRKVEQDTNFVINVLYTRIDYIWYKQGGQIPLLRIANQATNNFVVFGSKATNTSTGIAELSGEYAPHTFPNPTNGLLTIDNIIEKITAIKLSDVSGKLVRLFNAEQRHLDISELPSGVYLLQVETEKGLHVSKVLKN